MLLLLYAIMIATLTTVLTSVMMVFLGNYATAVWVFLTLILYTAVFLVLWITKSTRVGAHLFVLCIFAAIVVDYGPDGGYGVLATIAIPLAASALLGTKAAIVWSLVGALWAGYFGPVVFRFDDIPPALGLGSAIMTLVVGAAASIIEWTRAQAVLDAAAQRKNFRVHQERIRTFAESTFPGIAVTTNAGIVYSSPGIQELLGYTPTEFSTRRIVEYIHPDDLQPLLTRTNPVSAKGFRWEARLRHKDGYWVWLEIYAIPQGLDTSEDHWIFAARDIQDEKRSRERLLQAQRLESIGLLAAGISHDFNNLLTVIIGRAELMPESKGSKSILLAAGQAAELTSSLLAFGRRSPKHSTTIDVVTSIEQLEPMFRSLLGTRITFTVTIPDLAANTRLAAGQFEQILLNLVTNAKEAMPDGGVLSLEIDLVDRTDPLLTTFDVAEHSYIRLTIKDTGRGMSDETLEHAFDPFFSTKPAYAGSGLGLASVYGIVRDGGGIIDLESSLGRGTIVRLYLPEATAEEHDEDAGPHLDPAMRFDGQRCILVEDETSVRNILQETLDALGFEVEVASHGSEGLSSIKRQIADIVITDIVMPGMRGTELAAQLRKEYPKLPILLISGYADAEIERWIEKNDDLVRFLAKPFRTADLVKSLCELLRVPNS